MNDSGSVVVMDQGLATRVRLTFRCAECDATLRVTRTRDVRFELELRIVPCDVCADRDRRGRREL